MRSRRRTYPRTAEPPTSATRFDASSLVHNIRQNLFGIAAQYGSERLPALEKGFVHGAFENADGRPPPRARHLSACRIVADVKFRSGDFSGERREGSVVGAHSGLQRTLHS